MLNCWIKSHLHGSEFVHQFKVAQWERLKLWRKIENGYQVFEEMKIWEVSEKKKFVGFWVLNKKNKEGWSFEECGEWDHEDVTVKLG